MILPNVALVYIRFIELLTVSSGVLQQFECLASLGYGSSKRQQPHCPQVPAITRHQPFDLRK
jgi:hypothetical protein